MNRQHYILNIFLVVVAPILLACCMLVILIVFPKLPYEDTTHVPTTDKPVIHRIGAHAYNNDCVDDSAGYFDPIDSKLFYFFTTATGIQPYIVVNKGNIQFSDDTQKDEWARCYYNTYVNDSNALLIVYFEEPYSSYVSLIYGSTVQRQSGVLTPLIRSCISKAYGETGANKEMFTNGLQYVLNSVDVV